ncbi:MAG: deoxyribose-phosphate aldolase [Bacteroidales bacterium]|nr:deoxyribose-phosphate aldolase [Bacteroidales bacterium]
MEENELIEKITKEILSKLEKKGIDVSAAKEQGSESSAAIINAQELASYIDHTLLKPEATEKQFEQLCQEALQYKFMSVCVNSSWVPFVAKKLRGTSIKICSVIGFPLGEMDTRSKAFEARNAISNGAHELDMVINIGALKSGNLKLVEEDIRAIKRSCRSNTLLKVIIETSLLTDAEKVIACEISKKAGADFVKTSTGFTGGGATTEDIAMMRNVVGPKIGVKASGGIRDYQTAVNMIHAGANRIGAGGSVAIVTGSAAKGNY